MPYRNAGARRRAAHAATIPTNTVAPAISGTAQAGQTLTVTNGTWAGNAATYTRQWKRGGVNVGGGGLTYVVQAGDVGSTITCTVTATNSTGAVSATSAATGTVIAAGPSYGPELWPQPAFDASTSLTLQGATVHDGILDFFGNGDVQAFATASPVGYTLQVGDVIHYELEIELNSGPSYLLLSAGQSNAEPPTGVGLHTGSITVADATGNKLRIDCPDPDGVVHFASVSFKKVL